MFHYYIYFILVVHIYVYCVEWMKEEGNCRGLMDIRDQLLSPPSSLSPQLSSDMEKRLLEEEEEEKSFF